MATVLEPFVRLLTNEQVDEQVSSYQEHTSRSANENRTRRKIVDSTQFCHTDATGVSKGLPCAVSRCCGLSGLSE